MNLKIDSLRSKILQIIAPAAEVREQDFAGFGYSREHTQKSVCSLINEGLVKRYKFDEKRVLRLTNKGKKYLMCAYPGRFEMYFEGTCRTNKIRSDKNGRERNIRLGQILILFRRAGIKIFPDEKHLLNTNSENMISGLSGESVDTDGSSHEFYDFSEIRKYSSEYKKSRSARSMGMLIGDKKIFIVYHTGNALMKWQRGVELNLKSGIESEVVRKVFHNNKTVEHLMIAETPEIAERIVKSNGGKNRQYLRLDNDLWGTYFMVGDEHSDLILELLCDEKLHAELYDAIVSNLDISRGVHAAYDGIDQNGRYTLCAINGNLQRLRKLYIMISDYNRRYPDKKLEGHIICFDFQKEYVEKIFGDMAVIEEVSEAHVRKVIE